MIVDEGMAVKNGERVSVQCLRQCGTDWKADEPWGRNDYHFHKYIELMYVTEGKLNAYIDNKKFVIGPGEMIIIFPNEPHTFGSAEGGSHENIVIKMLPEVLMTREQTVREFEYFMNMITPHKTRIIKVDEETHGSLCAAADEYDGASYAAELVTRANILKLCAGILVKWKEENEIIVFTDGTKKENIKVLKQLVEHTALKKGCIKTHEAAKFCNLSDGYFIRFFKSVMGMSFTEYTRDMKIREAERLLKCTSESITDIAQELEYATASHFIKDFEKKKGISPGKYRRGEKTL